MDVAIVDLASFNFSTTKNMSSASTTKDMGVCKMIISENREKKSKYAIDSRRQRFTTFEAAAENEK